MIRFIAAIDSKLGMANDHGIPWQGKVPSDVAYFRDKTLGGTVLMGYGTYREFNDPLPERTNVVASSKTISLLPGFQQTSDARQFLLRAKADVWVIGGPGLFAQTLDLADELYLTRIEGDFGCTKFFPEFISRFKKISSAEPLTENSIGLHFEIWQKIIPLG
jgi:dihydrofolate reductase